MLKQPPIYFLAGAVMKVDSLLLKKTLRKEEIWWNAGVVVAGFEYHMKSWRNEMKKANSLIDRDLDLPFTEYSQGDKS